MRDSESGSPRLPLSSDYYLFWNLFLNLSEHLVDGTVQRFLRRQFTLYCQRSSIDPCVPDEAHRRDGRHRHSVDTGFVEASRVRVAGGAKDGFPGGRTRLGVKDPLEIFF